MVHTYCLLKACRVYNTDAELWFEEKIMEQTTRYSGFWRKNEAKIEQKMADFHPVFWPSTDGKGEFTDGKGKFRG